MTIEPTYATGRQPLVRLHTPQSLHEKGLHLDVDTVPPLHISEDPFRPEWRFVQSRSVHPVGPSELTEIDWCDPWSYSRA
jgi:hypothetical protein